MLIAIFDDVTGIRLDGADVVRGARGRPAERRHPVGRPVPVQQRAVRRGVQAGRRGRVQRGGGRGRQQTRLVQLRGPERPEAHRHLHGRQGRLQGHRRSFARRPDARARAGRARGPGAQVAVARPVVSCLLFFVGDRLLLLSSTITAIDGDPPQRSRRLRKNNDRHCTSAHVSARRVSRLGASVRVILMITIIIVYDRNDLCLTTYACANNTAGITFSR